MSEENNKLLSVKKLIDDHKLVDGFLGQETPYPLDTIEYRQNLAALRELLNRIPSDEVARIIEVLRPEERLLVWNEVREDRG
jgi:hypothetical protein